MFGVQRKDTYNLLRHPHQISGVLTIFETTRRFAQLVAFGAGMAHEILSWADDFLCVLTIFETTMMLDLALVVPAGKEQYK